MADDQEEKQRMEGIVIKTQYSKFKQQELPEWRPNFSTKQTLVKFIILCLLFLGGGYVLKSSSDATFELAVRYDEECQSLLQQKGDFKKIKDAGKLCKIEIEVKEDITEEVYVYYQINNMFQNHRTYVKSRNTDQLLGKYVPVADMGTCDPVVKVGQLWPGQRKNLNGKVLGDDEPAIPCGLIAKSIFNDTFELKPVGGEDVVIVDKGIAWETDIKHAFKNIKENLPEGKGYKDVQWYDMENERFIVWMRAAGLPDFRKLWGRIEGGLKKGKYELYVDNQYYVKPFKGQKSFVLATTNFLGGKNYLLATLHFVVGGLCGLFCIILLLDINQESKAKKTQADDASKKGK